MTVQSLIFRSGGCFQALALGHVIEVMRPMPLDTRAAAPPLLKGTSIIRGEPTPVLDLAPLSGSRSAIPARLLNIRAGAQRYALFAEEVSGVRPLSPSDLRAARPLLEALGGDLLSAVAALDAGLQNVLKEVRILSGTLAEMLERERSAA